MSLDSEPHGYREPTGRAWRVWVERGGVAGDGEARGVERPAHVTLRFDSCEETRVVRSAPVEWTDQVRDLFLLSMPDVAPDAARERDWVAVCRYAALLQERAHGEDDRLAAGRLDHEAALLLALARAMSGEALSAHRALLERATRALLVEGGFALCAEAEGLFASAVARERERGAALWELGRSLLEARGRFEEG